MHRYLLPMMLIAVPFAGLAADATPERGPLRLTLKRAIEIALSPEGNTYIQLSDENVKMAKYKSEEAGSVFLPDIEAQAGRSSYMKSLSALGLDLASDQALQGAINSCPSAFVCSIEKPVLNSIIQYIPRVVGPFESVDVRATATQSVFNFANIRRYQASRTSVKAAKDDRLNTDQQVMSGVAKAYLAAQRSNADVEAGQANVDLAEAVQKQAESQKEAGTGTGLDITRSKVQLSDARQHLLVAKNQRAKSYLQLLRAMGMDQATELELTDKLSFQPTGAITVEQARAEALKTRVDYKAELAREKAAGQNASAVKFERLPYMVAFADYGTTGADSSIVSLLPTRDYGFALRVPIFDGGRRDIRRAEAASQFRQERTRANDLREQIELDIRTALDSLHSAEDQLKVADEGMTLAESELTQTRRRFAAGFASSLEVADSQTKMERARDNRISALFNYNVARLDLGQAMGNVQRMIPVEKE